MWVEAEAKGDVFANPGAKIVDLQANWKINLQEKIHAPLKSTVIIHAGGNNIEDVQSVETGHQSPYIC